MRAVRVASSDSLPDFLTEEDRLIVQARAGDRPAFAGLVERYWDRLYRWLYHLTRDRHAAEDLVQETLLKAFAGLKRFQPGTKFSAWLFRIAHNNFANYYRLAQRRREALPKDLPARGQGPCEQAQSHEAQETLTRAIQRLPHEFRAALLLRIEEGLSFRQIAEVLELTEETARWRVFKARHKLLHLLEPQAVPRPLAGEPEQEKP
jgi:RNA polymerase sigma-70 factor (ECF subfamily)